MVTCPGGPDNAWAATVGPRAYAQTVEIAYATRIHTAFKYSPLRRGCALRWTVADGY